MFGEKGVKNVAEILANRSNYRLPIVYVKRDEEGNLAQDPTALADKLKGAAHVFASRDALSDKMVRDIVGDID